MSTNGIVGAGYRMYAEPLSSGRSLGDCGEAALIASTLSHTILVLYTQLGSPEQSTEARVELADEIRTLVSLLQGFILAGSEDAGSLSLPNKLRGDRDAIEQIVHALEAGGVVSHTYHNGTARQPGLRFWPNDPVPLNTVIRQFKERTYHTINWDEVGLRED